MGTETTLNDYFVTGEQSHCYRVGVKETGHQRDRNSLNARRCTGPLLCVCCVVIHIELVHEGLKQSRVCETILRTY